MPTYVKDYVPRLLSPDQAPSAIFILPPRANSIVVAPAIADILVPAADEVFVDAVGPQIVVPIPDDDPVTPVVEQQLRAEATSLKHLCTHKPSSRF